MTDNTPETPETPVAPEQPVAATPPSTAPAPTPVTIVRTPVRERLHGTGPTLAVFAIGTLFGALLSLGVSELAEDGPEGRIRFEEVRGDQDMPGFHMRGPGGR